MDLLRLLLFHHLPRTLKQHAPINAALAFIFHAHLTLKPTLRQLIEEMMTIFSKNVLTLKV